MGGLGRAPAAAGQTRHGITGGAASGAHKFVSPIELLVHLRELSGHAGLPVGAKYLGCRDLCVCASETETSTQGNAPLPPHTHKKIV